MNPTSRIKLARMPLDFGDHSARLKINQPPRRRSKSSIEPKGFARVLDRVFNPPKNTPIDDHFMQLGPRTVAQFNLGGTAAGQASSQ